MIIAWTIIGAWTAIESWTAVWQNKGPKMVRKNRTVDRFRAVGRYRGGGGGPVARYFKYDGGELWGGVLFVWLKILSPQNIMCKFFSANSRQSLNGANFQSK